MRFSGAKLEYTTPRCPTPLSLPPSSTASTGRIPAPAYLGRGRNRIAVGDLERAVADYTRVLEIDVDLVAARLGLARAFLSREQFERARSEIELGLADGD